MNLALFFTFEMSLSKWDEAGILEHELALYRQLTELGVQVSLFTFGDKRELEYKNRLGNKIQLVPLLPSDSKGKWKRFFISWLAPLKHRKALKDIDLVKTNQMWGAWTGLVCKLLLGGKWILRCGFEHHRFLLLQGACLRDRIFSRIFSWLGYILADAVIWSNVSDSKWAVQYFGLKADDSRFHVIPNYVDTNLFKPFSPVSTKTRLVTVARLDRQKNLESLIRALEGSAYELEIIGEGPLRRELLELSRSLGVKVIFSGRIPQAQIPKHLAEAGIFILCSRYEGMPKSLLEAMSCGMPVIGANVTGIKEIIGDEMNGLLCEPDPKSIRQALDRLFSDQALCGRMGAAARNLIEEKYSLAGVVQEELALYRKLCAKK